ncbi:MAG TPA: MaoC/PaaZ C-terminal domain-containing protein [Myxococcota bacterium]|nr:MaoC/PaaZ C-terminal domain-containing protein [Myxococcota bacterium]
MALRKGMYWEDFKVGEVFESLGRTITETDIVNFASFTGDWHPLHTDAEFAKNSYYGKRIAHGMIGPVISTGLGVREGLMEGSLIAFLALEWKFIAPIYIGDTVHQKRTVEFKRESRNPERGIIRFKLEIINQHKKVVQEGTRTLLVKRKPQEP